MVQVVSPQKPMQATCYKCKAELSFVFTEIQEKTVTSYPNDREYIKFIVCPCCQNEVSVKGYHS